MSLLLKETSQICCHAVTQSRTPVIANPNAWETLPFLKIRRSPKELVCPTQTCFCLVIYINTATVIGKNYLQSSQMSNEVEIPQEFFT